MLVNLASVFERYISFFPELPAWMKIVYIAFPVLALIICLALDGGNLTAPKEKQSRNTLHTAVWLCIIMIFPVFGAIGYLLASVLIGKIWHSSKKTENLPYNCNVNPQHLSRVVLAGCIGFGIGKIAELFAEAFGTQPPEIAYSYELAFLCWAVLTAVEWKRCFFRHAVYFRVTSLLDTTEPGEMILDIPTERICPGMTIYRDEAGLCRKIADRLFSSFPDVSKLMNQTGNERSAMCEYHVMYTETEWRKSGADVMDAEYLGQGITKYRVMLWKKSPDENIPEYPFQEVAVYRAVPRTGGFFAGMLVLQFVMLTLFSPWASVMHEMTIAFFEKFF